MGCRQRDQEIESKAAIQTNEQTGLVIAPKGYSQLKKTSARSEDPPHLADESEQVQGSDRMAGEGLRPWIVCPGSGTESSFCL